MGVLVKELDSSGMSGFWTYLSRRSSSIIELFGEHFLVSTLSLVIALIIGVGLGLLVWNRPLPRGAVLAAAGVILTIPSFALLGLLIAPLGLGWTPTVVALVMYALLPIVRNTVVGLQEVPRPVQEAARGVGMTKARVLLRVQLPIAWPVILTGARVSAQLVVGIAAIAAYVSGPGLGDLIFSGLSSLGSKNALNQAVVGTIGVVIVALVMDAAFTVLRRLTTSKGLNV